MRESFRLRCALTGALALAGCIGNVAMAQENEVQGKPMFTVLPAKPSKDAAPAAGLTTWNGSFVYQGTTYNYNMVGTSPKTGASVTVPAVIIPIKFITTRAGVTYTFDPSKVLPNGNTVTQNTVASPLFDSTTTYIQGGVNLGTTQYEDAFQRGNFWGVVSKNPNYHVLFSTRVAKEITITVPAADGSEGDEFGVTAGLININYVDPIFQTIITKLGITANELPIFLGTDVYLTNGAPENFNCCIGGYHSAVGPQAYAYATYADVKGAFSQDVSALSHELGEFVDDPLVVNPNGNPVACGILEVGDPLENGPNFGAFPYILNGFTYNLQDLVFLPYFGANPATSVNKWFTFQDEKLGVCSQGG